MPKRRMLLIAQVVALVQGAIWFVLLIFGGQGLLFGPAAVVGALAARRLPWLSIVMLVLPTAYVMWAWSVTFANEFAHPGSHQPSPYQMLPMIGLLIVPAVVAIVMIVVAHGPRGVLRRSHG